MEKFQGYYVNRRVSSLNVERYTCNHHLVRPRGVREKFISILRQPATHTRTTKGLRSSTNVLDTCTCASNISYNAFWGANIRENCKPTTRGHFRSPRCRQSAPIARLMTFFSNDFGRHCHSFVSSSSCSRLAYESAKIFIS